jgi:hypothetical protein
VASTIHHLRLLRQSAWYRLRVHLKDRCSEPFRSLEWSLKEVSSQRVDMEAHPRRTFEQAQHARAGDLPLGLRCPIKFLI